MDLARASLRDCQQTVKWIKGHAGHRGNELADLYARKACTLPPQSPMQPVTPFSVIIGGLPHFPPHKCWTEANVPTHRHSGIHPISFTPPKRNPESLPWIQWLFGLCWRPGWASYQSFWSQTPSRRPCPICLSFHNSSINGTLSFCNPHPLRTAWMDAWNHHPLVIDWLRTVSKQDSILIGKACIPRSLYAHLSSNLGRRGSRKLIFAYQKTVISLLQTCLDTISPPCLPPLPTGKRRRVWVEADWDHPGDALPSASRSPARPPNSQPTISTIFGRILPNFTTVPHP